MLLNIYRPTSAPEFDFEANFVNSLGIISWCMPSPVSITLTTTTKKTNFYDSYLSNFELIPYHSEGIPLPSKLSSSQLDYLNIRLKGNLEFIAKFNPKLLLFNGNPWYVLLIKHNLVKEYQKVQISKLFNIYFFEAEGLPSVLFDKFFQRHFWGITNYDRKVTIPKLIHERYQNV